MARFSQLLRIVIGVAATVQVVLGFYVWWSGNLVWMPAHILLGLVIIGGFWLTTLLASWAQVGFGRSIAIVALTLVLPLFGMAQIFVPSGPGHWVLMALHLSAAGAALGLATHLTRAAQDQFARGDTSTSNRSLGHARA